MPGAPTTRQNPVTGSLEVLQEDLNTYVQAVALLIAEGGYPVALIAEQSQEIINIASKLSTLAQIAQSLTDVDIKQANLISMIENLRFVDLAAILQALPQGDSIDQIKTQSQSIAANTNGTIQALVGLQTDLQSVILESQALKAVVENIAVFNNSILSKLEAVRTAIANGGVAALETPTIRNIVMSANTEYSHTFPTGTQRIAVKCRGDSAQGDVLGDIRFAWSSGKIAPAPAIDGYDVISPYSEWGEDVNFNGAKTLYLASAQNNVVVTVRSWS